MVRTVPHYFVIITCLLLSSCMSGDKPGSSTNNTTNDSTTSISGNQATLTCDTSPSFPSKLRRLTRVEYANILRDVIGINIEAELENNWPEEPKVKGFRNQIAGLAISDEHINGFAKLAEIAAGKFSASSKWSSYFDNCNFGAACQEMLIKDLGRLLVRKEPDTKFFESSEMIFSKARELEIDFSGAGKLYLEYVLQHPEFLYRIELPNQFEGKALLDDYELASRLSFSLWSSTPDEQLLELASKKELQNKLNEELVRMLADPRSRRGSRNFFSQWLELDELEARFPENSPLPAAMRSEIFDFIETINFEKQTNLNTLFTETHQNPSSLSEIYNESETSEERPGLLGLAATAVASAGNKNPSLVQRALYIYENFLCGDIKSPPPNATDALTPLGPGHGARQAAAERNETPACAFCHKHFDAFGLALEEIDGFGKKRNQDQFMNPLSSEGQLEFNGEIWSFNSISELSDLLANSDKFQQCFTEKLVQFYLSSPIEKEQDCALQQLSSKTNDQSYQNLVRQIITADWFSKSSFGEAP